MVAWLGVYTRGQRVQRLVPPIFFTKEPHVQIVHLIAFSALPLIIKDGLETIADSMAGTYSFCMASC